ncbi:MAG: response regulator [Candidatus Saganbacteria bacterium]|nr:response regulator [Candidatus Saganbacteria bacterium]
MTSETGKPKEILLVEDNPADARLVTEALKEGKVAKKLNHVVDGAEAMDYLRKVGKYKDAPLPDLILLDLNLPKKDGREVLAEVKADENLKRIPVVVLTISRSEEDIMKSYNLHANCYVAKPLELDDFFKVVKSIEDFWLTNIVKLPPK